MQQTHNPSSLLTTLLTCHPNDSLRQSCDIAQGEYNLTTSTCKDKGEKKDESFNQCS